MPSEKPNNATGCGTGTETGSMRALTFGEKAVGLTFNPGGDPQVTAIKSAYAAIIDQLNDAREVAKKADNYEAVRHFSVAITDAETAQMRAVKAITWK